MHYRRGEVTRQLGPRHGAIARPMRFLKSDQAVYQEDDGTFWVDREWQDPASSITWHTYEDLGVAVDEQQAASLPSAQARMQTLLAQSQPGCHPQTSVVVLEGTVGLQPNTAGLVGFDLTRGLAGAASDVATADSPLTPQGLQAFDQATSNLRDVATVRAAGQLAGEVADEFANVIVPSAPPGGP